MNDLSSQITGGTLLQYANDTALICSGSTLDVVHQCLSDDLSCLLSWVKQSKMQLNIEKSSIMWFRNRSLSHISPPDVVIDGAPLHTVSILGLYLIITWSSLPMLQLFVRRPRSICSGLPLIGRLYHLKLSKC